MHADWLEPAGAPCATGAVTMRIVPAICNSAGDCVPDRTHAGRDPRRPHTGDPCLPFGLLRRRLALMSRTDLAPDTTCAPAAGDCAEASTCDGLEQRIPGQSGSSHAARQSAM